MTFHQRSSQHGVHIPVEGVLWLVLNVFDKVRLPLARRIELAFHAILRHEIFHFAADCMAANWALATGVEVYWSSRGHQNALGHIELEEGLANAYMLRGFKHPSRLLADAPGAYAALKSFCERQPAGYQDGPLHAKTRSSYLAGCRYLSDDYHQVSPAAWHVPHASDTLMLYPDPTGVDWSRCPIILIDDQDVLRQLGISVSYFQSVAKVFETTKFQRELAKLDRRLQELWQMTKRDLARSTSLKSLDFKQWKKGGRDWYSVRVTGNFRAHLRYDRAKSVWFAEEIGDHKAMGHG